MPTKKNPAAVTLGRKGGKASTPAKVATARENGAKGGRPIYVVVGIRRNLAPKPDYIFVYESANGRPVRFASREDAAAKAAALNADPALGIYRAQVVAV